MFSKEDLTTTSETTFITPHLECEIQPGKNILWCSTFQLAWNEMCDLIGENIRLGGCCAVPPHGGRIMIFDKPFLILLKRKDQKTPYFALWVANAELLVKQQ